MAACRTALASRPSDSIQLAFARTHINTRAARREALETPGRPHLGSEYAVEADYGLQLTPWLNVQPNVQYIVNPGGERADHDVVVLGVKTALSL